MFKRKKKTISLEDLDFSKLSPSELLALYSVYIGLEWFRKNKNKFFIDDLWEYHKED